VSRFINQLLYNDGKRNGQRILPLRPGMIEHSKKPNLAAVFQLGIVAFVFFWACSQKNPLNTDFDQKDWEGHAPNYNEACRDSILFTSNRHLGTAFAPSIYIMNKDGSGTRSLTKEWFTFGARWSPQKWKIIFVTDASFGKPERSLYRIIRHVGKNIFHSNRIVKLDLMITLSNQVILITGASRGIGRATAQMAAKAGAVVAINYRQAKAEAESLAAEITTNGGKAAVFQADVGNYAEVEKMVAAVLKQFGQIDILVNNAGIWTYGAIDTMPEEVWDETMAANLKSIYNCCRLVVPHMKARRSGKIINVSSTAGQRGEAFHSHYAATKGAIISFTKSLAPELAPFNIRVNCVAPGWVATDMANAALAEEGENITKIIPLRRPGTAEEIAGPILFLASDLASYITGEIFNVNGGNVLVG
jgi:3-oxoacyl-[acyl-carrier protein] reductase